MINKRLIGLVPESNKHIRNDADNIYVMENCYVFEEVTSMDMPYSILCIWSKNNFIIYRNIKSTRYI